MINGKNGKLLLAVIGSILLLAGFVMGSMKSQIRATEKFVAREQYNRDIAEMKSDIKQLLLFHLEDRAARP